jgi:hypothetical protein
VEKWADFCISGVSYNSDHTHIIKVKVHEDKGDKVGAPTEEPRVYVVASIEKGKSFVTILKNDKGDWKQGAKVEIIPVHETKYIRTDKNRTAADNLENLPEF